MEFLLIATAHFIALLSPGPDFFLIVQAALRLPRRYSFAVCFGIAAGNGIYLLLAISGLESVRSMPWLTNFLQFVGGAYLIYLGKLLLTTQKGIDTSRTPANFIDTRHLGKQFLIGFLSALLNPKNIIFYLALFATMVSPQTGFVLRVGYGLWMIGVVLVWDCALVLLLSSDVVKNRLSSSIFTIEKVSGTVLTLFGVFLPLM